MRIGLLAPGGFSRDGETKVIPCFIWLVEKLVSFGNEVHVFVRDQEPQISHWKLLGASIHNAGGSNLQLIAQIAREHRQEPFEILHAMWAVPAGVWAGLLGRLFEIPVVIHLAGGDLVNIPEIRYGGRRTFRSRIFFTIAMACADRILVPSRFIQRQADALGIKTYLAPFGVSLELWRPVVPRRRNSETPAKLIHVASLNRVKDQETLLKSMSLLRDWGLKFHLDVIGSDTLNGSIQQRAKDMKLESVVHFRGSLLNPALRSWVQAADLLVMTSRHEAGPIVALEAATVGVPTVGTAVGHLADWAKDDAARVVAIGDAHGLAEAIAHLLTRESERYELAQHAQEKALELNSETTTRGICSIYDELTKGRMKER